MKNKSTLTYLVYITLLSASIFIILIILTLVNAKKNDIVSNNDDTKEFSMNDSIQSNYEGPNDIETLDRVVYADGFYYETISEDIKNRILGISYPVDCPIPLSDLRYVKVKHVDIDGNVLDGELIVAASVAQDVVEIFKELFDVSYPIERIRLIDEYNANDDLSMEDNNSSGFNYRVIDGTDKLSLHSLGTAIDINPLYNPYVRTGFGKRNVLPVSGQAFTDRDADFPYKIEKGDACYNAFISRGWKWGGEWTGFLDYQHFYKE